MPIIRPNKGYLRKYSPLTPLPLTPLRVPMDILSQGGEVQRIAIAVKQEEEQL